MQHNDILTCDFNEQFLNENEFLHIEGQIKAERLIILLLIFFLTTKRCKAYRNKEVIVSAKKFLTVLRLYTPCLDILQSHPSHKWSISFKHVFSGCLWCNFSEVNHFCFFLVLLGNYSQHEATTTNKNKHQTHRNQPLHHCTWLASTFHIIINPSSRDCSMRHVNKRNILACKFTSKVTNFV